MTEREKSYAEMLYQPADPELAADRDVTVQKLYEYNRLHPLDRRARAAAIRGLFGSVGENCVVEQPLFCTYGYNVTDVCIITEEHAMDAAQRAAGLEYTHPVTIGDNVWIAAGALVLPGVTIGEGSVIGAGSVVTRDVPPYSLAVGNPCRVIRQLK